MLNQISQHLKHKIQSFTQEDSLLFNNKILEIDKHNFQPINGETTPITFIDGGQGEIISTANFHVAFIRVAAITFHNNKRIQQEIKEFYLVTTAKYENELIYESKIFGDNIIDEQDLTISSKDPTIAGNERAPISSVTNMARRFAELALAQTKENVVLDGTLEPTFKNEEKYLSNVSALAKSSSLFTTSGNSPVILLNGMTPHATWHYHITDKSHFVKLHEHSQHVFRFEGNTTTLASLQENSSDPIFLGYPYGLIAVDVLARVTEQERKALKMQFLLNRENQEITKYLSTSNAHDILDNIR